MPKILEKTKQFFTKRRFLSLVFLFGAFFLLVGVLPVSANEVVDAVANKTTGFVVGIIGSIASIIVNFLGLLISILMSVLIAIAQYNNFIGSQAVINGWVVIRDLCNMFFIVILLVIAFSVILRIDGYDIKKMIPKMLIMAVLINFSKTICGLIIDAGQIIMLTFVASFKDIGPGNLTDMLGIKKYLGFGDAEINPAGGVSIIVSYAAAIIFLIISLVVIVALLSVLVMRIIMLWIWVVLSPLAFFLASFPQGKSYSQRWWKEFTEAVIVGPVLAFFLWLAFVSLGSGSTDTLGDVSVAAGKAPTGLTEILTGPAILKYVISVGMLLAGLVVSQSLAGQVGGAAGKAMGRIQGGAGWAKKNTVGRAKTAAIAGGAAVGGAALAGSKIALGSADKLVGAGVGALGKKVGLGRGQTLADRGLVGGLSGMAMAAPGNMLAKVKDGLAKKRTLNDSIYQAQFSDKKEINHNGKKYQANKDGKYQMRTDDGKAFEEADKPNAMLMDGGKNVTTKRVNNPAIQAWHGAIRSATSGSRAASDAVEDKRIEEESKKIKSSGMSNEEARRKMTSSASTVVEKKALAMHLANEKGFENIEQKQQAEKALGGNGTLVKKFGDTVVKNQVHLAYNLEAKGKDGQPDINVQAIEKGRLKKDISKGTVDVGNLPKEALANNTFQTIMHEAMTIEKTTTSGKKIKDDSRYVSALRKNADGNNGANYKQVVETAKAQINKSEISTDNLAPLFAELSGDFKTAFENKNGAIDYEALGKFFGKTSSKGLSGIGSADFKKFTEDDPKAAKAIAMNMTFTKVKALDKEDDTRALADELRMVVSRVSKWVDKGETSVKDSGGKIDRDTKIENAKFKREADKIKKDYYNDIDEA